MTVFPIRNGAPRPRRRLATLVVLAPALLAGCAGLGLRARYGNLQEQWQRTAPTSTPSAEDDRFAGAPFLERTTLVAEVLRRNPTLHAARQAWRAALARYPQQVSLDDPMLGYGVSPTSFGSRMVDDAHQVELSQVLPFPGKLTLRGQVALAEAEAASHDFEAVRLGLATMASLLFDDYYVATRARAINAEHVELLRELQRIAAARYEAGDASQQDPLQAEVELARRLREDVLLETAHRVTAEQINLLLHRRAERPLPPPPASLELDGEPEADAEGPLARALARRPELLAAQARVRSREAAVALAEREFLPDFTLMGAYNGMMPERDVRPMVGIAVNVPLRLARRRAALDESKALLQQAQQQRESVEDEVRFGVRSALDRLDEARRVLAIHRDRLLPAARDQLEAARAGFETGRNGFLELIESERNLLEAELGYEEALAGVSRRRAEIERATGALPTLP